SLMFSIVHELLHGLMEITSQLVDLDHTVKLHTRIYAAIRKGDPEEARSRMTEHLMDAKELLRRSHESRRQSKVGDRLSKLGAGRAAAAIEGVAARKSRRNP